MQGTEGAGEASKPCDAVKDVAPVAAFALLSPQGDPMPSTRIACLNLFPHLRAAGITPEVRWEPETPTEVPESITELALLRGSVPRVVVLQKIRGAAVVKAVRALRRVGVRCIWCVCDIVDNEMVAETDATIAVTEHLRGLYAPELQPRIHVVHDGIEDESLAATSVGSTTQHPVALLVTSQELNELPVTGIPPRGWRVHILGRYPASRVERVRQIYWSMRGYRSRQVLRALAAIGDRSIKRTPWSKAHLTEAVNAAQIGIIPVGGNDAETAVGSSEPAWRVKSENRLTLLMAAGLPVVASPIPAYEQVIVQGSNGFLASTSADWQRHFAALRDPGLREEIGRRARSTVLPRFSTASQAKQFVDVIRQVLR